MIMMIIKIIIIIIISVAPAEARERRRRTTATTTSSRSTIFIRSRRSFLPWTLSSQCLRGFMSRLRHLLMGSSKRQSTYKNTVCCLIISVTTIVSVMLDRFVLSTNCLPEQQCVKLLSTVC